MNHARGMAGSACFVAAKAAPATDLKDSLYREVSPSLKK
jgi:hypothetical protein